MDSSARTEPCPWRLEGPEPAPVFYLCLWCHAWEDTAVRAIGWTTTG